MPVGILLGFFCLATISGYFLTLMLISQEKKTLFYSILFTYREVFVELKM